MLTRHNKGELGGSLSQEKEVKEIAELIKDLPKDYKKILISTLNDLLIAASLSASNTKGLRK